MLLAATVLFWGFAVTAANAPPACDPASKETIFLAALAGDWDVDAEFRAGETFESASGRATIQRDLDGCVFVQRYEGTRWGKPYAFVAILGASSGDAANPIQEVFVHSQHGILSLSSGRIVGGELVIESAPVVLGQVVLQRHVYFGVLPASFRTESRRSTDRGASWTVSSRARYRRAAPSTRDLEAPKD